MAKYVALTTVSGINGYYVVYLGETGESSGVVYDKAAQRICGDEYDRAKSVFTDTQLKNLMVISRSQAERKYHEAVEWYLEEEDDEERQFNEWQLRINR